MDILSHRHHYVPRFLIKNFCGPDNLLWVYNKEEKKILKNPQSPKAIFFEKDRNLFNVNGIPSDNVEKMYGELDDMLSKTLDKFLVTKNLSGRELTMIIYLASLMKWRVPKVDKQFKTITSNVPIENLGMKIRAVDNTAELNHKHVKEIEEEDIIQEIKRLLLSVQPIMHQKNLDDIHKNCFIVSYDAFPGLIGDCPLIESANSNYKTLENFIFPLSTNETLVCKRNAEKYISNPIFYNQKDLTIFHLAEKFVGCSSREYLESMIKSYKILELNNKTNLLEKYLFEFVK